MYLKTKTLFKKTHCLAPRLLPGSMRRCLACTLLLLQAAACTGTAVPERHAPPGWSPSMDALVSAVVDAVYRNDREALEALGISEQEYALQVWPDLPIAKIQQWQSQRNFVWTQHHLRSTSGLSGVLKNYGGTKYALRKVFFKETKTAYEHCAIHGKAVLLLADQSGDEHELRFFGSIIEKNGFFKVFSYNTD